MAYAQPQAWYVHSGDMATTGYWAISQFSAGAAYTVGQRVRPLTAQTVGNERVYICTTAGTSTTEPTWTFTKGANQVSGPVAFGECSGESVLNGDMTGALQWTINSTPPLGRVIYDPSTNTLQFCTVSALGKVSAGSPVFQGTLGQVTTTDGSARWTCLGPPSNYGNWAAPCARLSTSNIAGAGTSGNDFYVADNSLETTTAAVVFNMGSTTLPSRVMSVDRAAPTTLKTGASITSSATAANNIIFGNGGNIASSYYGMTFIALGATGSPIISLSFLSSTYHRFENCSFQAGAGTNINGIICVGTQTSGVSGVDLINCTFGFIAVGQGIQFGGGPITWRNTPNPCVSGTIPNPLMKPNANTPANVLIEGVDLSAAGSVTLINNATSSTLFTIKNCKLHSGAIVGVIAAGAPTLNIDIVSSDTGALAYRNERYNALGQTTTNTAIVRTGGASDGGTPISHYLQPTGFARAFRPYTSPPLMIWNDVIGSVTVTLYGAVNLLSALPRTDQFWFDLEYMGTSGSTIASLMSTGLATPLTAPATVAISDGSSWSGLGGTNAKFSMSATFTAAQKGYITVYPKASTTYNVYIDPKLVLS